MNPEPKKLATPHSIASQPIYTKVILFQKKRDSRILRRFGSKIQFTSSFFPNFSIIVATP